MLANLTLCVVLAVGPSPFGQRGSERPQITSAVAVTVDPPRIPRDSGAPVPEPTTLLLVGGGLVGLAISSKRWRRTLSSKST